MNQLNLFDTQPDNLPTVRATPMMGSVSGNAWHGVCEARMISYGFHLIEKRYLFGGALEYDGWFKNDSGLHVLAEYKERINQRVFKELVGQARIALMLQRSHRMVIIVLTGHIEDNLLDKSHMVNAASDDIYLIAHPQHPDSEKFLKSLASVTPERTQGLTYDNLSQRIRKQGGFLGRNQDMRLH